MNYPKTVPDSLVIILLINAFLMIHCQGQSIVDSSRTLYSRILNREVAYSLLLPHDYYKSESADYPIIYLLHGYSDDNNSWLKKGSVKTLIDSLRKDGSIEDFIYVMPNAYNSFYINNYDNSFRYMDFFMLEFIPAIDSMYRVAPGKENSALIGLSMGGFGSLMLGLTYPDYFGYIVSHSASVRNTSAFMELPMDKYNDLFGPVFGFDLSGEQRITKHWKANSPYFIDDSLLLSAAKQQNWYIDCGQDDYLLPANESFHTWLLEHEIPHEYHIRPGEHNWEYWYRSTIQALLYLEKNRKEK